MDEPRFGILRVIQPAADVAAARRADDDRHRRAAAVAVAQRRRLVDDLIEAARDEVGELHLGDRPVAAQRRADADADDRRLGNRRVDDAHLAELLVQPLRHAERAAVGADVLAEHEHLRIAPHLFGERLADGFEVGQLSVASGIRSVTASSGLRVRRVHRELHRFVDRRRDPRLDFLQLLVVSTWRACR